MVLGFRFGEDRVGFPAGLEEVVEASCGNDVEDELALELDDNPGTTKSTTFSALDWNKRARLYFFSTITSVAETARVYS